MMKRLLIRVRLRIRSLFAGERADAELQRELQFHIDEQTAEHIAAGMSPDEARAAALRAFGPRPRVEEGCRDTRRVMPLLNVLQDLRYAGRGLKRQPVLLLVATLSIALGVGANTTIFGLATEFLLASPTAERPDRLVMIRTNRGSHASYNEWKALHESRALDAVAGYQFEREVNWRGRSAAVSVMPFIVTANYFDVLRPPMELGRGFTAAEARAERDPSLVVVSRRFWERELASDPGVIGRPLTINGRQYTIMGVLPAGLRAVAGYGLAPDLYLPLSPSLMPDINEPMGAAVQLFGRLRDGQSLQEGRAAVDTALRRFHATAGDERAGPAVAAFTGIGGVGQLRDMREVGAFFAVLLVVVALVLAIACANVAGLLLARGTVRRREMAVRASLGASRARLVQQLLTEGLWLALVGTCLGLLLTALFHVAVQQISLPLPFPVRFGIALDLRLGLYSLLIVLFVTVLCAFAPALHATRPSLVPALKQDETSYGYRRFTLRNLLVVGQIAVSVVLIVTALLFLRNLAKTHQADPGFDVARGLMAQVSFVEGQYDAGARGAFLEDAAARLRSLPEVEHATYAMGVPLTMRNGRTTGSEVRIEGVGDKVLAMFDQNFVGPDYFATLGIPLLQGRDFTSADRPGSPVVGIINQEFARRYFGGQNPLGRRVWLPGRDAPYPVEIVGTVRNSKHRTLGEGQRAALYETYLQRANRGRLVHFLVRTRQPQSLAAVDTVRGVLASMDPSAALEVRPLSSALAFAFLPSRIGAAFLGALGILGLLLAMVGLYAVIAYGVSTRTGEIGIRLALGASRGDIARLVLRDGVLIVAIGVALGLASALLATQPLAMFLVTGLKPGDPVSFLATTALLVIVSLTASWWPARRATKVDPARVLRYE